MYLLYTLHQSVTVPASQTQPVNGADVFQSEVKNNIYLVLICISIIVREVELLLTCLRAILISFNLNIQYF